MAIVWDYPGEPVPEETFTTASQNIQRQQQEAPPNNEYFRLLAALSSIKVKCAIAMKSVGGVLISLS